METALKKFVKKLKIEDIDLDNLKLALTHPSFTKESGENKLLSYERLEFLGDAVLKLASSKYLYEKYPDYSEGILTKIRSYIISDEVLSEFAKKLGFSDVILLSKTEKKAGGADNTSILACAFESVLGAIFLTYGLDFCCKYLEKIYKKKIIYTVENLDDLNPKANLQEWLQGHGKPLPEYKIINETGPAHKKIFECEVSVEGQVYATATANSKKKAQSEAARLAYLKLEKNLEQ